MKETNETTACRITITLDSAELPVDEQARNALLTEFRSRAGHLVEGLRGIDADQGDVDEIAPIPSATASWSRSPAPRMTCQIGWSASPVQTVRRFSHFGLGLTLDEVGDLLTDDDRRRVGVPARDLRHDRCVGNTQPFNPADPQLWVDDG